MSSHRSRIEKLEEQVPVLPKTIPLEELGLEIDGTLYMYAQLSLMSAEERNQWGAKVAYYIDEFVKHAMHPFHIFLFEGEREESVKFIPRFPWRLFIQVVIPEPRTDD